jgi:hypothetical protein
LRSAFYTRPQDKLRGAIERGTGYHRSRGYFMDLKEKVEKAIRRYVETEIVQLKDQDGIFGFVVSA